MLTKNYNTKPPVPSAPPPLLKICVGDFGFTAGISQSKLTAGDPDSADTDFGIIRDDCKGWTHGVSLRLHAKLKSVVADKLSGHGYALTTTFRNCPETPVAMHKVRRAFIKRLERRGLIRLLWICEFQLRGVPHFHFAAYFNKPICETEVIKHWCKVATKYRPNITAQTCVDISNVGGWFGYMQKHVERGVAHYQRQRQSMPEQWKQKTGRVYGFTGDWKYDEWQLFQDVFDKLYLIRDCEVKKRLSYNRCELADITGSHFAFLRQTGSVPASAVRYHCWERGGWQSENYASLLIRRATVALRGIGSARRIKKRSLPEAKVKQLQTNLSHLPEDKQKSIVSVFKNRFSRRRGIRGTGLGSRQLVLKVMEYERDASRAHKKLSRVKSGAKLQQTKMKEVCYA